MTRIAPVAVSVKVVGSSNRAQFDLRGCLGCGSNHMCHAWAVQRAAQGCHALQSWQNSLVQPRGKRLDTVPGRVTAIEASGPAGRGSGR